MPPPQSCVHDGFSSQQCNIDSYRLASTILNVIENKWKIMGDRVEGQNSKTGIFYDNLSDVNFVQFLTRLSISQAVFISQAYQERGI